MVHNKTPRSSQNTLDDAGSGGGFGTTRAGCGVTTRATDAATADDATTVDASGGAYVEGAAASGGWIDSGGGCGERIVLPTIMLRLPLMLIRRGGQCGCSPSPTNLVRVEASGDDIIDDKDAAVTAFPEDDLLPFLLVSVRHGLSSLVPDGGG